MSDCHNQGFVLCLRVRGTLNSYVMLSPCAGSRVQTCTGFNFKSKRQLQLNHFVMLTALLVRTSNLAQPNRAPASHTYGYRVRRSRIASWRRHRGLCGRADRGSPPPGFDASLGFSYTRNHFFPLSITMLFDQNIS